MGIWALGEQVILSSPSASGRSDPTSASFTCPAPQKTRSSTSASCRPVSSWMHTPITPDSLLRKVREVIDARRPQV